MKREIKFRAKDRVSKEWVFGSLLTSPNITPIIVTTKGEHIYVDEDTVGQMADFPDRLKSEIYEGDVIIGYIQKGDDYEQCKYEVEFTESMFLATPLDEGKTTEYDLSMFSGNPSQIPQAVCEVIGNIYDNPEFSKKQ